MAQARSVDRTTPAEAALSGKRITVRQGAGKAAADTAEVTVSKARYSRIADKRRPMATLLAGYADTIAKAKKNGRSATLIFRISPNGDAEPVADVSTSDPLDAALDAARARGQAKVADILRGEDMLTAHAFGRLIGASHETVNTKRRKHEVLGLEGTTRGVRYPRWQVSDAGLVLPGLPQLFAALGEPWTVYRFLRTAHPELGGRVGLDALKAGQIEAVMAVAEDQAAGAFA